MHTTNTDSRKPATKSVRYWLYACAAIVFAIVVIGGITRLTRSGLSITEWKPVSGVVPPLSEAHWQSEFDKYKATPEYHHVNRGMSLDEFKNIYWWEFIHRIFARLVGVVFLIPFLWFLYKRQISRALGVRLAFVFFLGGFQGFLGWYMVKSGLVNDPHVSHLRLMSHLMTAVLIYALMLMTAWGLKTESRERKRSTGAAVMVAFAFLILASGALVAGLKAGKMYNTFPLMNGAYFPPGTEWLSPGYTNFYNNPGVVQFEHRNLAYAFGLLLAWLVWCERKNLSFKHPLVLVIGAYILQVLLGVLTLLHAVPVSLGALHQTNALILFTTALWYWAVKRYAF